MIDWIQVLLGQPLEEEREDGLEALKWAVGQLTTRRSAAQQSEKPAETTADRALTGLERRETVREGWVEPAEKDRTAEKDRRESDEAEERQGDGEALWNGLRQSVRTEQGIHRKEPAAVSGESAGDRAGALEESERLVWKQSRIEELTAENVQERAEWAAAQTAKRTNGSSAYLQAALSVPPVLPNAAGRLLSAMTQNDQAMTYQTTARQAEREENAAWTGTDPIRMDRIFERDARRYDNGFAMY